MELANDPVSMYAIPARSRAAVILRNTSEGFMGAQQEVARGKTCVAAPHAAPGPRAIRGVPAVLRPAPTAERTCSSRKPARFAAPL